MNDPVGGSGPGDRQPADAADPHPQAEVIAVEPLSAAEFCVLQRQLVERMAMRKKRNIRMAPIQTLKLRLLDLVEMANPPRSAFAGVLLEAVHEVSEGGATGPAQAVASDLQMDWELACASPAFAVWLRRAAAEAASRADEPQSGPRSAREDGDRVVYPAPFQP